MSACAVSVSVEEYPETAYRPDCDYVYGEIVERNLGEYDHSRLQTLLSYYLVAREMLWGITGGHRVAGAGEAHTVSRAGHYGDCQSCSEDEYTARTAAALRRDTVP